MRGITIVYDKKQTTSGVAEDVPSQQRIWLSAYPKSNATGFQFKCGGSVSAGQISSDIDVVNQSSGEIATNSDQVKSSANDLQRLATELTDIVANFKI